MDDDELSQQLGHVEQLAVEGERTRGGDGPTLGAHAAHLDDGRLHPNACRPVPAAHRSSLASCQRGSGAFVGGLLVKTFLIPLIKGSATGAAFKWFMRWLRGGTSKA